MWGPTINNRSPYRGDDLRRFILRGLTAKGALERVREVEVIQSPFYRTGGGAYCDEARIQLVIPRGFDEQHDLKELAQVFEHEIDHILGLDHKDMIDWWTFEARWHRGLRLRRRKGEELEADVARLEREIRVLVERLDKATLDV